MATILSANSDEALNLTILPAQNPTPVPVPSPPKQQVPLKPLQPSMANNSNTTPLTTNNTLLNDNNKVSVNSANNNGSATTNNNSLNSSVNKPTLKPALNSSPARSIAPSTGGESGKIAIAKIVCQSFKYKIYKKTKDFYLFKI